MIRLADSLPPWGTLTGELAGAALAGGAFLAILAFAELWQRRRSPPVEWTRKFVHFAGGAVIATFPWLFASHWTVLVLGLAMLGIFVLAKRVGWLTSVTGVERVSKGERWYPVGVYLLFVVARHEPVFWLIALSALIVSDTVAALLGRAYGRHAYFAASDRKSIEGSAAFFIATFLGVHVPLLLFTPIDRGASLIIALQLALLVTSFEAISLRGNDNLVVPLATYYLLVKMTPKPAASIGLQLAVQIGMLLATLLIAGRMRALSWAGALAAHLALYAAFSLGGPAWSVAPALALATFVVLDARRATADGGQHQVHAVFWVSIVGVALIFFDNSFATLLRRGHPLGSGHPFYVPFVGAMAAPTAIMLYQFMRLTRAAWSRVTVMVAAIGIAWIVVAPLSLAVVQRLTDVAALAVTFAICASAMALYVTARRWWRWRAAPGDLRLQAIAVAAATAVWTMFHLRWTGHLG